jgi:PiT family inorganic phosphate transporter
MELFGQTISVGSGIFLLLALGLALSFEFVNGFTIPPTRSQR